MIVKEELLFRSKLPLVLYIWIILSFLLLACIIIFLKSGINNLIIMPLFSILSYYLFCRSSCTIQVYKERFKIRYLLWKEDREIKFEEIIKMDYKKGFYDFRAPVENKYHFKLICYDTLFLNLQRGNIQVNINSRLGSFNKLREIVSSSIR